MVKEYFLEFYIILFEKICEFKKTEQIVKFWNAIKNRSTLLEYATQIKDNTFRSKIIAFKILEDSSFYESELYFKIVNYIFKNKTLARARINESSFLSKILENKNLQLTKEQKQFVIFEAESCPHTEKYYQEKITHESYVHGYDFKDIRYKILKNISFSLQEKTNLFMLFYPDNEVRFGILNDLEWEISRELDIVNKKDYSGIYCLDENDIIEKIKDETKVKEIIEKINLCKNIRNKIPEEEVEKFKNNF